MANNGSGSKPRPDRFLKPGALARIRDSKISAATRSPSRSALKIQILVIPPSPVRLISTVDGSPCFAGRIHGPSRFLNRKKVVATRRIFFTTSGSDPSLDLGLGVLGSDLLLAH